MILSAKRHFFLFKASIYYLGDKQFIGMNPAKLAETISNLQSKFNDIKSKIDEFKEKYESKIVELNERLDELNKMKDKSQQYIDTERKKIEKQIDDIKANIEKKIAEMTQTATDWLNEQIDTIKTKAAANISAKFGIDVDVDEIMKSLKK